MRVRVLGGVVVTDPAGRILPRPQRKAREVLTVLVWNSPAAVSLDELADTLWDVPPAAAVKTIRAHLSRLGSLLAQAGFEESVVRATPTSYRLLLPADSSDLDVVRQLRRRATRLVTDGRPDVAASLLTEARRLWTGDLELAGTTGALPLQRSAQRQRHQLIREHLRCVVDGADPGQAVAELEGLTAADPTDEPTWGLYVQALHRSGHHAEAVRALADARRGLGAIGLEPGGNLKRLETEVFTDTPATPAPIAPPRAAAPAPDDTPVVTYTHRRGHHVAHTVLSQGPRDLVVLNPAMITIDGLLEEERARRAISRLADNTRVICLDRSGIGLSDPLPDNPDPLTRWSNDVIDVLDELDIAAADVLASFDTGLVAIRLAAHHPQRVRSLALAHCYATYTRQDDYPYGLDQQATAQLIRDTVSPPTADERIETAFHVAPSASHDGSFRRWWTRIDNRGAGPHTAATIRRIATTSDVRPELPNVTAPALVVHRRSCLNLDIRHAHYLAERLPNARLAIVPGTDSLWFTDTPHLLDHVLAFLDSQ